MEEKMRKKLYVRISFGLSLIVVVIMSYLILKFVPSDLDFYSVKEKYINRISSFVNEKSEMMCYIYITIFFPILFILFFQILMKIKIKVNPKVIYIIDGCSIVALGGLIVRTLILNDYYRNIIFLNGNKLVFFILFYSIIVASLFLYKKISKTKNLKFFNIIIYSVIAIVIVTTSYIYINNSYSQNAYDVHHTDAYLYPIYKVNNGLTLGIDFNSIYGYYSYFFSFIMKLFNLNSIFSISCIVTVLVFVILLCLAIFLNKVIKNKIIYLITFLSIIYVGFIKGIIITSGIYLQYIPHRMLFPALMLLYILFYLKSKNKFFSKILGAILVAFSIFWNFETGFVVLLTLIMFFGYEILYFNSFKDKKTYKEIFKVLVFVICSLVLYVLLINVITFIRTGQLISLKSILFGQDSFWGSGFNMIRMKLWHPWILIALTYGIALAITIKELKFLKNENNPEKFNKNIIVFILAILGIGVFSYYQGRSHNECFKSVLYPGIILLGIFLDYILENFSKCTKFEKICECITFSIIITILVNFSSLTLYSFLYEEQIHKILNKKEYFNENVLEESLESSKKLKEILGKIDFYLNGEHFYYLATNQKDTKRFQGAVDTFTREDNKKVVEFLKENKTSLCINFLSYKILSGRDAVEEIAGLLESDYKIFECTKIPAYILINKDNYDKIDELINEGIITVSEDV